MNHMHIDRLDMAQIRLLAELNKLHNVSAAAQAIGLSQSAASHALAKLRKQFGDPLFIRIGSGVQPTPYGERLGVSAHEALAALAAGIASNRPFNPLATEICFTTYMSDVGQMVFLPKLIAHLKQEAPGATVRSMPIPLENPGAALSSGDVNVAVGFFANLSAGFHQSVLFRERYVCVVRSNHPLFRSGMSTDTFLKAEHAMADSTGMAHAVIERELAKHRMRRRITLRIPEFHVLPMIVANSDLVVIMPSRLASAFATYLPIKILRAPITLPTYEIRVYWHERFHQDSTNRWLRRALFQLFRVRGQ